MPTRSNLFNNRATSIINAASTSGRRITAHEAHRVMSDLTVSLNLSSDSLNVRQNRRRVAESYGYLHHAREDYEWFIQRTPMMRVIGRVMPPY